jgi:hypothetical protein
MIEDSLNSMLTPYVVKQISKNNPEEVSFKMFAISAYTIWQNKLKRIRLTRAVDRTGI